MTIVFMGGSRRLTKLAADFCARVDKIASNGFTILIGDANGADKCVQEYLHEKNYAKVVVFHTGETCRNNVGKWPTRSVKHPGSKRDFQHYAAKDLQMAKEASCGFMLWDGRSKGTLNNIVNLLANQKPVLVYFTPQRQFCTLNDRAGLQALLGRCGDAAIASFEKKLDLSGVLATSQSSFDFA